MDAILRFVPPGGYRACVNCATAKAKCIQLFENTPGGKCERCVILPCHPPLCACLLACLRASVAASWLADVAASM